MSVISLSSASGNCSREINRQSARAQSPSMRKYSSRLAGAVRGRTSSMNSSKFSHFCRNFTVASSFCATFAFICARRTRIAVSLSRSRLESVNRVSRRFVVARLSEPILLFPVLVFALDDDVVTDVTILSSRAFGQSPSSLVRRPHGSLVGLNGAVVGPVVSRRGSGVARIARARRS